VRSWLTRNVEETQALGEALAGELAPNGALMLSGTLGAGKTVLVQGLAQGLGIDPREIQSPTFNLIREHFGSSTRLTHVDLYRLEGPELETIGLEEIIVASGVKVIEWADRWPYHVENVLYLEVNLGEEPGHRIITEGLNTLSA
jgi:tRNA threonylcarbamoyladenosine biosynthesis protein TsaE